MKRRISRSGHGGGNGRIAACAAPCGGRRAPAQRIAERGLDRGGLSRAGADRRTRGHSQRPLYRGLRHLGLQPQHRSKAFEELRPRRAGIRRLSGNAGQGKVASCRDRRHARFHPCRADQCVPEGGAARLLREDDVQFARCGPLDDAHCPRDRQAPSDRLRAPQQSPLSARRRETAGRGEIARTAHARGRAMEPSRRRGRGLAAKVCRRRRRAAPLRLRRYA